MSDGSNLEDEPQFIALVVANGSSQFLVGPIEYWVLDWKAWDDAFDRAGFGGPVVPAAHHQRFGIDVLDETTVSAFLARISNQRRTVDQLREALRGFEAPHDWFEVSHLFPSVLVDFDARVLKSVLVDTVPMGRYVPSGWRFEEDSWFDEVPRSLRYWLDGDVDYLSRALHAGASVSSARGPARRRSRRLQSPAPSPSTRWCLRAGR